MALTPEEQQELDQLLASRAHAQPAQGAAGGPPSAAMLDPQFDLMPQGLAAQPATTDPKGDANAEAAWKRDPVGETKGKVFVYEPPLAVVQKRLAEDPQFAATLSPSLPPDQARIAGLTKEDSLYQAATDLLWRETADAAASNGKTAIRYSRAPWLQGGGIMSSLKSLGTKLQGSVEPGLETFNSFVMGVDQAANLGAGRAVDETISGGDPKVIPGIEQAGIPQENAAQYNQRTIEDHPVANIAGEGLAMLKPWTMANRLFGAATGRVMGAVAPEGAGLARRALGAGLGAAAGGAVTQAGSEAVNAGASMAQTGSPGTTLGQAASNVGAAALNPVNLGLGVAGEGLGSAAAAGAEQFREGPRYGGAPGRFERLGGEFQMGKGPVAPQPIQEMNAQGKKLDVKTVDIPAKELAPHIEKAVADEVKQVKQTVEQRNQPFYESREGQMKLPVTATETEALNQLRSGHHMDSRKGGLAPINGPEDVAYTRKFFNRNIDTVSLKPVKGAIALSPDEAQAFLNGHWSERILPKPKKPPPGPSGGVREVDLGPGGGPTPGVSEAPSAAGGTPVQSESPSAAPEQATRAGLDTLRPGRQARADMPTAPAKEPNMKQLGSVAVDPVREAGPAIRRENARMEALDKETKLPEWKPDSGKTYISDLYDKAKGAFGTRAEFDRALMNAHRDTKGGILQRVDLPEAGDAGKLKASRVKAVNGDYDLVDTKHATELLKKWGVVAGGAAIAGAGAAKEDDTTKGAAVVGLASMLKRRGISEVYVVPKRFTAAEHEVLKDHLQTLSADPSTPEGRQARQLYKSVFIDRDARPMNGVAGGWSAHQNENSAMIDEVKSRAALASPKGDAFGALVDYSKQREGQLPLVEAVRKAADRAGVRGQLDQLRMLDPLQNLRNEMSMGRAGTGRGVSPTVLGVANRFADAGMMRFGYPGLQGLSGPLGPIRGGMAGRFGRLGEDQKKEEKP